MVALSGMGGRSRARRSWRLLALLVGAVAAFLIASSEYVGRRYAARVVPRAEAPDAPLAVVFGAGLAGKEPSPLLAERVDAAVALYRAGKVRRILMSGDNSDPFHDETEAIRRRAASQSVPAAALVENPARYSTYKSCLRARDVYGTRRAILVTQRFHLPRALYLANAVGIDAWGVAADEGRESGSAYAVRELFSRALALWMVLLRPSGEGRAGERA